jgi:hypothetical protein
MSRDPRIDAYIAKSAEFAKPILRHLRELVHRGFPGIEESIKWGMPHFDHHGIVCSMAAFKEHCAFGFWKGSLVFPSAREQEAMGQFGRIRSLGDLPPDAAIVKWVRLAAELNERGEKVERPVKHPKPPIPMPADLKAGLARNSKARKTFDGFPPSGRREYLEWITEAKSEDTRARRLATALEWLAEGKPRHWKYQAEAAKTKPKGKAAAKKKTPGKPDASSRRAAPARPARKSSR